MKVSIITMHNYPNYGSVLQAFATQEKLKAYSGDVELIDYSGGHETVGRSLPDFILSDFRSNPKKALARLPLRLWKRAVFGGFAKRHMHLTANRYTTEDDFNRFPIHDGFYCTGSDQLWNPFFNENMPFFLNFVPEGKRKFSYAVSFGNYAEQKLNPKQVEKISGYIHQYDSISVREKRGLSFLKEQLGYHEATQLVDPTLAMPPEFWRSLSPKSKIHTDYILLYQLGREPAFSLYADEVSKRTGLPIVRLCSQNFQNMINAAGKTILLPPVLQFIALIDNAKYVITDSFHGAAFSMNLNSELIVYREEYDGERISDFLRLVGQEHRHVKSTDNFDILDNPTDFESVNAILECERGRTDAFLNRVFYGESEKNKLYH